MLGALGVEKGVPDLVIVIPPPRLLGPRGAMLELKAIGGKPTDEQIGWIDAMSSRGDLAWACAVGVGLESSWQILTEQWGYELGTIPVIR